MTELSKEYQDAMETASAISLEYTKALAMYRRRELDDNEFLAIRRTYDEAHREFDKAYDKEQRRQEQAEREARFTPEQILQMELLK